MEADEVTEEPTETSECIESEQDSSHLDGTIDLLATPTPPLESQMIHLDNYIPSMLSL